MLAVVCVILFYLVWPKIDSEAGNKVNSSPSCVSCHADFSSLVPPKHPVVAGKDIKACTTCHVVKVSDATEPAVFSSMMHRAHTGSETGMDCSLCHVWTPAKRFSVIGSTTSWGALSKADMMLLKKVFASWSGSQYLDSIHARSNVMCAGCHGGVVPKADDTVDNGRCLSCHGPMQNLVAKTTPKDFPDRNPHKSHLGDIACAVCHKSHEASTVYCLSCHVKFTMKIPGSAENGLQNK
jgi:hypothetical protein